MNNNNLDKFYTKSQTAITCLSTLRDILSSDNIAMGDCLYIEPSAGDGVFVDTAASFGIRRADIYALDIAPGREDIKQQDWFEFDFQNFILNRNNRQTSSVAPIVIYGNPPFGKRSTLAKRFISKSVEDMNDYHIDGVIAFILPSTFSRISNQKCFGDFRLVSVIDLGRCEFREEDDTPFFVSSAFYILTNMNNVMRGIDLKDKKHPQPSSYQFLYRGDCNADFVLNGNSGKVREASAVTNSKAEHYIKVVDGYSEQEVKQAFVAISFPIMSSCSGGNWWINQNDINGAFIAYASMNAPHLL